MMVARLRVLLRTIVSVFKCRDKALWTAYVDGVNDYKRGYFGKGSLNI